jgi:hypothetical protein
MRVAGSAIQAGHWLPEAEVSAKNFRQSCAKNHVRSSLVCMTPAMRNGDRYRPAVAEYLQPGTMSLFNPGIFLCILRES